LVGIGAGPDRIFAERYVLLEPMGRPGAGSMWKARDLRDARLVALKLMPRGAAEGSLVRDRLRREIAIASRLVGSSFVSILENGEADGRVYMAMELLDGESLRARLGRLIRLSHGELVHLSTGVRDALSRAHALGIVHRDIKPANVFYARGRDQAGGETITLLDLGIAKDSVAGPRVSASGTFLGTPHYMSPEQLKGSDVDARADLWSTAVILYQALTGTLPFRGPAPRAAINIATSSFEPPSSTLGCPQPAIDAFFARAFCAEVDHRFATIEDLHQAFIAAVRPTLDGAASGVRRVAPEAEARRTAVGDEAYSALAASVTREIDVTPSVPSGCGIESGGRWPGSVRRLLPAVMELASAAASWVRARWTRAAPRGNASPAAERVRARTGLHFRPRA
jgi:serine/threonine-protein kinase